MNDRAVALLEQYDVEILRTRKGRGVILCDTDKGLLVFKQYEGNEAKLALIDRILSQVREMGRVAAEGLLPTREGALCVRENDGTAYILKTCGEGRECNIFDRGECREAVRTLARLHQCMVLETRESSQDELRDEPRESSQEGSRDGCPMLPPFSPLQEYEKHNREFVKVQRFLRKKSQKSDFEYSLLKCFDYFIEQARELTEGWRSYEGRMAGGAPEYAYCHGDYQYHNILCTGQGMYIVNFEKCIRDRQIRDLYLLMRKLLEKTDWPAALGRELLAAYGEVEPIGAYAYIDLYYRLAYPEKFWKIVNFYYNSGKAWVPQRNQEKLDKLLAQEKQKKIFLENVFQL